MALSVWLYGDLCCPWSYLAFSRLRVLSTEFPVIPGWRPLESSAGDHLPMASEFEFLNLPAPARPPRFESGDALQAAEFSRDLGPEVLERTLGGLFAANFDPEERSTGREALLAEWERLGHDRPALERALEDGRYAEELERARAEADRYGIEQVPSMLVGTMMLVGAAPLDVLAQVVMRQIETGAG